MRSAAAWNATSTTGPSSAWSRSRSICGWPGPSWTKSLPPRRSCSRARRTSLAAATEELRELARGLHPPVLTDRGLVAALESLAGRSPLPVSVEAEVTDRAPPSAEAAAYFVVSEALTNVVRHAQAEHALVRVDRPDGRLQVEIHDDGRGGADAAGGSGLRGLSDRVAALDGSLEVESRPGGGTVVRAVIPVAS